ncbi:MAG: hypothetical protein FJ045_06530 [Crenarchaeota archaeon]|nr:hypothetical protein [Thermoproteota archaeon]
MEKAYFGKAVDVVKFFNSKRRNIKVLNYGACTGCLGLLNRIQRLNDSELRNELILVMGPDANVASVEQDAEGKKVILCGYCAAPTFYNELQGEPLLGCPPPPTVLANKIKELSGLS